MIKRVVVTLHGPASNKGVISAAAGFASRHGARLTGLFVKPEILNYATVYGAYPLNLAQNFSDLQESLARNAEQEFEQCCQKFDCETQWHTCTENEVTGAAAIYSDFMFVPQPKIEDSVIFNDLDYTDRIILESGIPAIVIPTDWTHAIETQHPMVGWNRSREAVRAVRTSLDLLRESAAVDIVVVNQPGDLQDQLADGIEISAYLGAHDIDANHFSEIQHTDDSSEAEALQRHAKEHDCDLLVIGGYGHSRLREIILGGVTRQLVRDSDIPVLIIH